MLVTRPESRPTYDQILNELRTDRKYITENVNENEFKKFIKYIEEQKISFNSSKSTSQITSFAEFKTTYLKNKNENDEDFAELIYAYGISFSRFPFKYFKNLSDESQKLVEEAGENSAQPEKLFEVGRYLIEGSYDFPIDVKVGLDYIKESINKGNKNSLIYYIEMLIKGNSFQ